MRRLSIGLGVVLLLAGACRAHEVEGVKVPDTLQISGKTLKINGVGLRKRFNLKIYVGALYLTDSRTRVDEIINQDLPRTVRLVFLRDVSKNDIIRAYREGLEKNSKDELPRLQSGLDQLGAGLEDVMSGDVMTVTYMPGQGTTVAQDGGTAITVAGKAFADAVLLNWLGKEPVDEDLKQAMLAGK